MNDSVTATHRAGSWGVGSPKHFFIWGPRIRRDANRHPRGREAPELNRLGVQGRAEAPLAPPEAKNLINWMPLWLKIASELINIYVGRQWSIVQFWFSNRVHATDVS